MNKVLLVIDMQYGLLRLVPSSSNIVSNIKRLVSEFSFDCVVLTKFVNTPTSPFSTILQWYGMTSTLDCLIHKDIKEMSSIVLEKSTYGVPLSLLENALLAEGISLYNDTTLYVVGIDTDACVLKTVLDLFDSNVRVTVVEDCCATSSSYSDVHEYALCIMRRSIGKPQVVDSDCLIDSHF